MSFISFTISNRYIIHYEKFHKRHTFSTYGRVIYIQDYPIDVCVSHYYLLVVASDLFEQPLNVQKIRREIVASVILSEDFVQ